MKFRIQRAKTVSRKLNLWLSLLTRTEVKTKISIYAMEHSPSSEADNPQMANKFPAFHVTWRYGVHSSQPPDPKLRQVNLVQHLQILFP